MDMVMGGKYEMGEELYILMFLHTKTQTFLLGLSR